MRGDLWRSPGFRRLYATRVTSQLADGMVTVALTSFVFFSPERQASAADAAAAFSVLLLPYSLVGPFAGVFLDRWRRRQVLVVGSLVRAGLIGLLATLVAGGTAGAAFFATGLATLSVNRFFLAGLSAALPHVVDRSALVTANSLSTTSGTLVALIGGGVGFVVRLAVGGGGGDGGDGGGGGIGGNAVVLLLAATTCCAAALVATRMHPDRLGPDRAHRPGETLEALRHVSAGVVAGARHVWDRRPAAYALGAITAHRFVYGLSTISTVLLYRNYFHDAAETGSALGGLALAVLASGVGFLLAALLTPAATRRVGTSAWIAGTFALAAATEAFYVVGPLTEATLLAGALVVGFVAQASKICVDTIVQRSVDDTFRGRVFSFYDVLFNVSFVAAAALAALVVPPDGYSRALYAALALAYAATALAYALLTRGWRASAEVPGHPQPQGG